MTANKGSGGGNITPLKPKAVLGGKAGDSAKNGRPVKKRAVHAQQMLNEAYEYQPLPSSFSRALRVDLQGSTMLFISGTASVDENGDSIHIGDFRAQTRRTLENVKALLEAEGFSWHDVVKTTCYLRDIERDYDAFNEVRTQFYDEEALDPLPASVGVQAHICRANLLVEVEALAIREHDDE
ncbi:Rid family hydrolase [candidate division KSB1 bacterium]